VEKAKLLRQQKRSDPGRKRMRSATLFVIAGALLGAGIAESQNRTPAALTGVVKSAEEGQMEGVLVSAKPTGGTITVTVVSDKEGRYAFPANSLKPGKYNIAIRAIGYDAPSSGLTATVGDKTTALDIQLSKTADLASQLSSAEWLMSVPGTEEQKDALYTCIECHTAAPIVKSTYDASGWMATLVRMRNYSPQSTLTSPVLLPYRNGARAKDAEFAQYLSSINLSLRSKWDFALKTLPRPSGADTRVIITEYDLPRADRQPHDVVVDAKGMVWYEDFALPLVGRMDPSSGQIKEWDLPELKPGYPEGSLDLELDRDGNPWVARVFQAGITKFDKTTEKATSWTIPAEYNTAHTRTAFLALAPQGFVWINDSTGRRMNKLEPATGKIESYLTFPGWTRPEIDYGVGQKGPKPLGHLVYGIGVDTKGTGIFADRAGSNIGTIDAQTGKVELYPTPSVNSGPRRMHVDSQGRAWFAENYAFKLALFDTKTKQFQEWADPTPWDAPYDLVCDKDGYLWTGGMTTDLITRFNPKTGQFFKYLLPNLGVNVRRVEVDDSPTHPVFWVGENHLAKIAKIQPLE
jgi:virginiamycin B lyase